MQKSESGWDESSRGGIERLRKYLGRLKAGRLAEPDEAISLLQSCWDEFDGSSEESTAADKLDRAEEVVWKPPLLTFALERHGGTVQGSSRAGLHRWEVNIEAKTASCDSTGHRQLRRQDNDLVVAPLAREIADLILSHREDDERLRWYSDGHCRVEIGKVIPDGNAKRTTEGRRKRFREALKKELGSNWVEKPPNSFQRINRVL